MRIVHHTDAEREYAYDRQSHVGKLDKALDEAKARLDRRDMKQDWNIIFPLARRMQLGYGCRAISSRGEAGLPAGKIIGKNICKGCWT